MSYLDTPRFSFLGGFHADVPTRNNDLNNFAPDNPVNVVTPGDWNSDGSGNFWFRPGKVMSAVDPSGRLLTQPAQDRLIGAVISSRPHDSDVIRGEFGDAKIVDLDPWQRRLSTIFGLQVTVDVGQGQAIINGTMEPTCFRDYWNQRVVGGDAMPASTCFQSILTDVSWNGDLSISPLLEQLEKISPDRLSIKFTVDRFNLSNDPEASLSGRLIGSIGPWFDGEPQQYVAERRLVWTASSSTTQFWAVPCKLSRDRTKLVLDLGNSVQVDGASGKPKHGQVHAVILPTEGSTEQAPAGSVAVTRPIVLSPPLDTTNERLELAAGIVSADVTSRQAELIERHRVGLLLEPTDTEAVLAEHPSGKYIDVDEWVYRLDPGDVATIQVRALRLGKPLANQPVPFYCETRAGLEINLPPTVFDPSIQVAPVIVTTDRDGLATLKLTAQKGAISGLPAARRYIDSQVYLLGDTAGWQSWGMVGPPVTPASENAEVSSPSQRVGIVSILLFNTHDPVANPTWEQVGPIFQRYAKLYPAMRDRIDLGLQAVVQQRAAEIAISLQLPRSDPRHMPGTRDLSAYERNMMLKWLAPWVKQNP